MMKKREYLSSTGLVSLVTYLIEITDLELEIIDKIDRKQIDLHTSDREKEIIYPYTWTSDKTDLIELLRGIVDMGSINGGSRVHYKEFIPFVAKMFNVDLKNHESLYGDIRRRKGREGENFSRLKYLRQMIDTLEKNMQTLDEKQHSRE